MSGESGRLESITKVVGIAGALAAGVVAIATYEFNDYKARADRADEVRRPFREAQLNLYKEAMQSAADIATRPVGDPRLNDAYQTFYGLYWGPLCAVEQGDVREAMKTFEATLSNTDLPHKDPGYTGRRSLENLSMNLAKACRRELGKTWHVDLPQE